MQDKKSRILNRIKGKHLRKVISEHLPKLKDKGIIHCMLLKVYMTYLE